MRASARSSRAGRRLSLIHILREEIGREIRRLFIPAEGCVLLDADYSQIELRVLAHISGDETMINAFLEGEDIHTVTASQVFGVPRESVTPEMRRRAKAVNFGIVYGISDFSLAQDIHVSRAEAKEYIEGYFHHYPKIKRYLDETVAQDVYKRQDVIPTFLRFVNGSLARVLLRSN